MPHVVNRRHGPPRRVESNHRHRNPKRLRAVQQGAARTPTRLAWLAGRSFGAARRVLSRKDDRPQNHGCDKSSVAITFCVAGRASMRCKYGAMCGSVRAGRRMLRVQRQSMKA
jgi:hypothetical protein